MSQYVHYIDMKKKSAAYFDPDQFPILQHGVYANHAAIAPWPRVAAQAVSKFATENCEIAAEKYATWLLREKQLREKLATLIHAASADDIALLKNTTEGICTVANGINWRPGDNVVLPANEFPSNRLPWLALSNQEVEVREVDIRETDNPETALLSHIDKNTRLLSVSAIQWTDGLRLNLKSLGTYCRQNGVLFFVDAIQQLGAMQIDVEASHIDFLAADGHKWLLSPEGIAVFYSRQAIREQIQIDQVGWHMVDNPYQFNREEWVPSATALRFEAGSPNMLGQAAMHASVGLLLKTGMQTVESLISDNSKCLYQGIVDIPGIEPLRPFEPDRVSGIISFRPPDGNPAVFHTALKQKGLVCAVRGGGIRLSPHYYQAGEPILEILNIIEQSN